MLNSKIRTLFRSSFPRMWCKSVRSVHDWVLDQSQLTGIETQLRFPTVLYWVICRRAQTIDYVIIQTVHPSHQNFKYRTVWNIENLRTMNAQNLYTLQVFQSFSRKRQNFSLQICPGEFIRFLCWCIVNLLRGNLQSIKSRHVTKFQNEVRCFSLKRTVWLQRRHILASEKGFQLIKVITPPVIGHLAWCGAVCPRPCFCVQQQ